VLRCREYCNCYATLEEVYEYDENVCDSDSENC